jgi:hypothetical protein
MADGQMSVLPVAFSLMASFMSAITLLGVSQVILNYWKLFNSSLSRNVRLLIFH